MNWPILPGPHQKRFNPLLADIRFVGSSGVAQKAATAAQTTIGSTATLANVQAAYNAIYADAIAAGLTDSQAALIAAAAATAYASAINAGQSQTQAEQAASAAALAVALNFFEYLEGLSMGDALFAGERAALAVAFAAFMATIPLASQQAALAAWNAWLAAQGITG